ncbi:hypothetical protein D1B31_22290 [Neobacillus notoginsengisoli]|uniref:Membrane protein YkvI n=1 Tax=Neobacillus notoginsengisoli TaxID=1578198 RepID=A0A417YFH1_9BACI|nr:hypothetical protein [Neobacillus notoginsengisoli]RHW31413.1 hypothetical protein D1B31_22290 [Neobacillus notoginsengisoli]
MKRNWTGAFQIAAVYVGTVVGAGFATGREIVEFFSRFGFIGFLGILVSGYLLISMGSKLMRTAARINVDTYQGFNEFLFGKRASGIINILMLLMLLGVTSVMMSGAGAVFEEQLGTPRNYGVMLTIILSVIVMYFGTKALFAVNTLIVPAMIMFSLFLMVLSVSLPGFTEAFIRTEGTGEYWKGAFSPFLYIAFNLGLSQAVLVPVAAEVKDDWTIKWGGIFGGAALTIILLSSHLTMIMLPNLETYDIPMAAVMRKVASSFHWVFILVVYAEIFTSVIGNIYGLERQIKKIIPLNTMTITTGIFAVSYFASLIHYGTLLSFLYPLFGYVSLVFLVLLWAKPLPEIQ